MAVLQDHIGPVRNLSTLNVDVVVIVVADTDGGVTADTLRPDAFSSPRFAAVTGNMSQVVSGFCSVVEVDFPVSWIAVDVSLEAVSMSVPSSNNIARKAIMPYLTSFKDFSRSQCRVRRGLRAGLFLGHVDVKLGIILLDLGFDLLLLDC